MHNVDTNSQVVRDINIQNNKPSSNSSMIQKISKNEMPLQGEVERNNFRERVKSSLKGLAFGLLVAIIVAALFAAVLGSLGVGGLAVVALSFPVDALLAAAPYALAGIPAASALLGFLLGGSNNGANKA